MKHLFFSIFLLSCWFNGSSQAQWEQAADLPGSARHHPVTFSIDGFGYVLTGMTNGSRLLNDFYRYDPSDDSWTTKTNFPGAARSFSYGVAHGGKAYVGFGLSSSGYLNDLWEYDPTSDSWKQLATCGCAGRRHPAMLVTDNGKLFVGMGDNGSGDLNDWWEYDIASNTWTQRPSLPGPVRHHPYYFAIGNEAYVGFGHSGRNIYKDFYVYQTSDNSWTKLADFPGEERVAGAQFDHKGLGFIISGEGVDHQNLDYGEFYSYDPILDEWTERDPHPGDSRWATGTFVIDDRVYLVAGEDASSVMLKSMWSYDLTAIIGAPVSTDEVNSTQEMVVYPNPFGNELNIAGMGQKGGQLRLIDLKGQVVKAVEISAGSERIDVSELPTGMYLLEIESEDQFFREKMIKE